MQARVPGAYRIDAAIAPAGAAGYGEDRNRWTLGVTVGAWRGPGGKVSTDELFLRLPGVHKQQLAVLMRKLPGLALVRLDLHAAPERCRYDGGYERWEGVLDAVVATNIRDADLAAWVEAMRKPLIVRDEMLGSLTFDRALSWYEGRRVLEGAEYKLAVVIEDPPDVERDAATLESLRARVGEIEAQLPRYRHAAGEQLLVLYNDEWRDDDAPRLTREQFTNRLVLASVYMHPDGGIDIFFGDADLFGGHQIHLRLDAPDAVPEVGLVG